MISKCNYRVFVLLSSSILIMIQVACVMSECSTSGTMKCTQIGEIDLYEWRTCLNADYISKLNDICGSNYCTFGCVDELYNRFYMSPMPTECQCTEGDAYDKSYLKLPTSCYAPTVPDDSWYSRCLQQKYDCSDNQNIRISREFGIIVSTIQSDLTNKTRQWFLDMISCLQYALIPTIRPAYSYSCDEIDRKAADSRYRCYYGPKRRLKLDITRKLTICRLDLKDIFKLLWSFKSSKNIEMPSASEFSSEMLNTVRRCDEFTGDESIPLKSMRYLRLTLGYNDLPLKGSSQRDFEFRYMKLSNTLGNYIADKLHWDQKNIHWYFNIFQDDMKDNIYKQSLLKYDKFDVAIFISKVNNRNQNDQDYSLFLNETIRNIGEKLTLINGNVTSVASVVAHELRECHDLYCWYFEIIKTNMESTTTNTDPRSGDTKLIFDAIIIFAILTLKHMIE